MFLKMLDPSSALELWNESLSHSAGNGLRLSALSVVDAWAGKRWAIQYRPEMKLDGPAQPAVEVLVAQRFPNSQLESALANVWRQEERVRNKRSELAPWISARTEDEMLLYPFPLDPRLRSLPDALDEEAAWRIFSTPPCLVQDRGGRPNGPTEVLRYVPGKRCVVRYTFSGGDGSLKLIGKIFRDDRGESLFRTMEAVSVHFGCQAPPGIVTPSPLAYLPGWNMLVQTHLDGKTLYELLHENLAADAHFENAARVVALLHAGCFPLDTHYVMEDEVQLLAESVANLDSAGLADHRYQVLLQRLTERSEAVSLSALVPVHRDFYDKQLLIDGPLMALIDLDTLALGPPEIDLANFLAHVQLRRLQGLPASARAHVWARLFFQEYRRSSSQAIDEDTVGFFMAAAFLRLACKYRIRDNSPILPHRLLGLTERTLEAGCHEFMECAP